jgi:lipopolysaccharide heptosyltransferase I
MSESNPHFLVIRLSSIGDIVHTLPAVAALGDTFPNARIDWLVEKRHAPLLSGNPYVHRIIHLDTLKWRHNLFSPGTLEQIAETAMALREESFDAVVDFQGLLKSAFLARISRSGRRLGFAEYWLREPLAGVFYSECVSPRGRKHVIEINFSLAERFGVKTPPPEEWIFPLPQNHADDCHVESRLSALGVGEFIVLNPGGGWKSKCWAPENYAELIRRLERETPASILLTGSPSDEPLIQEILGGAGPSRAHYFPSTILQLISLARRARLFVGGDTGPVHLAEAAGAPVVEIFSSQEPVNTPERNGPFRAQDIVVANRNRNPQRSRNKHSDYLRDVPVESVHAAIRERLARAHG